MKLQIKHCTGGILYEAEAEGVSELLALAVKDGANLSSADLSGANLSSANLYGANLSGADLSGADLSGANLYGANLSSANLYGANLYGADLSGANLYGANLSSANLHGANLYGADLSGANLYGANLSSANLHGANLYGDTIIETGETWQEYLTSVVPALLVAGGRALAEVLIPQHWDCHNWNNCPMAAAFKCKRIEGVPILLKPRAEQFVRYFDAKLLPLEAIGGTK